MEAAVFLDRLRARHEPEPLVQVAGERGEVVPGGEAGDWQGCCAHVSMDAALQQRLIARAAALGGMERPARWAPKTLAGAAVDGR